MANWYVTRSQLKQALQLGGSSYGSATGDHAALDSILETVSRHIDEYVGFHFYESSGTRYYTPKHGTILDLDAPLLTVGSIQTSSDAGKNYGSTMTTDDYVLAPYNATEESPPKPFWTVETRDYATSSGAVFPAGMQRGVKIAGTWGYFNKTRSTSADLTGDLASGTTSFAVTNATALSVGMTVKLGDEKMFITRTPASASGAHTSTVDVLRAQNGTTNSTHSGSTGIVIYEYPIIEQAALTQAEQEFTIRHAPQGFSGGGDFGAQRPQVAGGLHPFVRRMLDPFRAPTVI